MRKQKTILILGCNSGQLDLIKFFKDRDWWVVSCSNRKGEVGEKFSDEFFLVDIVDTEKIENLAKKINADLIYSISSDIAMKSAIFVSEKIGLPHFYSSKFLIFWTKNNFLEST